MSNTFRSKADDVVLDVPHFVASAHEKYGLSFVHDASKNLNNLSHKVHFDTSLFE